MLRDEDRTSIMIIQESVSLAPLTTLRVGGPARYFVEARNEEMVLEGVAFARASALPLFVLGGGSNLVVADRGWPGLVVKIGISGIEAQSAGSTVLFEVGAGENWDVFVAEAVRRNCAGIECLSGIPGCVGGTPVQNVGAYGQEVSETIESVRALDLKTDRVLDLDGEACVFGYRSSVFNTSECGRYIILRVRFRLRQNGDPTLKYADLKHHFAGAATPPSLAEVREAVREIRLRKGMLIVPDDPDCRSAGSFFKNPVLNDSQFQELARRAESKGLEIPSYPSLDSRKIPAAWLVEHSGFAKGYLLGAAGISHRHALALINTGTASAGDIVRLKEQIQRGVRDNWGIALETEPVFVGFGDSE